MSQVIFLGSGGGGGSKGVLTVPTDNGTATPNSSGVLNLITGLSSQNCGATVEFKGSGNTVELNVTDSLSNTLVGLQAGIAVITGVENTGFGAFALQSLTSGTTNAALGTAACAGITSGSDNTAVGNNALGSTSSGNQNVSIGSQALFSLATGSSNVSIGFNSGNNYAGAESNNVLISNVGVLSENGVIRIGTTGTQTKTFISGIRGVTTSNANAIAVLIDSAGQLGTVSSSNRYKENIADMGMISANIYKLRPVVFNYKTHSPEDISIGLIAEEVENIMPQMVVYKDDLPETVKYQDLPILLLNELQKLKKDFDEYKRSNP